MKEDAIITELLSTYYVLDVTGAEALRNIAEDLAAGHFRENISEWGCTPLEFVHIFMNLVMTMERERMIFRSALEYYAS